TRIHEAAVLIQIELVLGNVIGDVEIQPPVAIEIVPQSAEAPPVAIGDAQFFRNFGECPVAVVVKQEVALGLIGGWVEGERNFQPELLRGVARMARFVPYVSANVEVEITIAVVIAPGCAGPEAFQIGEPRIAHQHDVIVAKEHQRVVAGYEQIKPAVTILVTPRGAYAADAGFGEMLDLLEGSVADVVEEQRWSTLVALQV